MVTLEPNDDFEIRNYQDLEDTDENVSDVVTQELTDDPTETLGVDPNELKAELDKYSFEDGKSGSDDRREQIEDLDDDGPSQDE